MVSGSVVSIKVAAMARGQRVKRCSEARFHEVMDRLDVQFTFTRYGTFITRDGNVIAALIYGARKPYLIDSATEQRKPHALLQDQQARGH